MKQFIKTLVPLAQTLENLSAFSKAIALPTENIQGATESLRRDTPSGPETKIP